MAVTPMVQTHPVFTIYLDQNMWIGLKSAVAGTAGGARFVGLPETCQTAVDDGLCRFVLSYSHYEETSRRPQLKDREQLATVMAALSRFQTIAIPQDIIRQEIRLALFDQFDVEGARPSYSPFGVGADFAMGFDVIADGLSRIHIPTMFVEAAREVLEFRLLVGPDSDHADLEFDARLSRTNNTRYAEHRNAIGQQMKDWSKDRHRADRFALANELVELISIVQEVGEPMGIDIRMLTATGRVGMEEFLARLPMESTVQHLHRASLLLDRSWTLNDHNDVVYLSSAAAYCDAVIGERHWTSKLREPKCPTRAQYILSSPEEFRDLIHGIANGSIA